MRPKGEFTRHATVHTNGHIYEIEYIAKNLVIRPAGEDRTITLLNFLPDQINLGLGELPYGRSIRVSQDEGTWDSYFQTRTSCKTQGPYNIHIPTDGSGVFRGSYDSDIIIAGKGADDRALSTYIYGCGGSDRLYANDNNHTLSAVA